MIGVIIQARMSSKRLPGKIMADIKGQPMLAHVLHRAGNIPGIDFVGIATTLNAADDLVVQFAQTTRIPVFRGDEQDVLDRFYQSAKEWSATTILRITADCPILDPAIAGKVLERYISACGRLDYVSNNHPPTFPDGLDTEVFSFSALEQAWKEARLTSEREHVTPYLANHPEIFNVANVTNDVDYSPLRWTVDESQDLNFVRAVLEGIRSPQPGLKEVLTYLKQHPKVHLLNKGIQRNEGYHKSQVTDLEN